MKMFETLTTTGVGVPVAVALITTDLTNNTNSSSDEHEELLAEMELIERLPTQERLKQAKRRRALQLKKWSDYERECNLIINTNNNTNSINNNSDEIEHLRQLYRNSFHRSSNKSSNRNKKQNRTSLNNNNYNGGRSTNRSIKFQDHIVLLDAIMRKDYDEVERILNSGITPNSANEDGLTAIHQVCALFLI